MVVCTSKNDPGFIFRIWKIPFVHGFQSLRDRAQEHSRLIQVMVPGDPGTDGLKLVCPGRRSSPGSAAKEPLSAGPAAWEEFPGAPQQLAAAELQSFQGTARRLCRGRQPAMLISSPGADGFFWSLPDIPGGTELLDWLLVGYLFARQP